MWNWEEQINGVNNSIAFASYISMCWIGGGMCEYSKRKERVMLWSSVCNWGFAQLQSSTVMLVSVHSGSN